jgi:hypothetical protein
MFLFIPPPPPPLLRVPNISTSVDLHSDMSPRSPLFPDISLDGLFLFRISCSGPLAKVMASRKGPLAPEYLSPGIARGYFYREIISSGLFVARDYVLDRGCLNLPGSYYSVAQGYFSPGTIRSKTFLPRDH